MSAWKLAAIMTISTATVSVVVMPKTASPQTPATLAQASSTATTDVEPPRPAPTFVDRLVQGSPWTVTNNVTSLSLELVFEQGEKFRVFMQNIQGTGGLDSSRKEMKFVEFDKAGTLTFVTPGGGEYEVPAKGLRPTRCLRTRGGLAGGRSIP
jgi:hypothetical protein